MTWYWRMLAPFAILPLLCIRTRDRVADDRDQRAHVVPYTRDYRFHYSSIVVAGCAVATVEGIAWLTRIAAATKLCAT